MDVDAAVLVEVVPDPRPVREQVLDGDAVVDEREIGAEDGSSRCRELDQPFLSMRLTIVSAVKPFVPLAIANRVSTSFAMSYPR